MGQKDNVKETTIKKGWEVLRDNGLYTQRVLDIIGENLSGEKLTIEVTEDKRPMLRLPVLSYDNHESLVGIYHYIPYQKTSWYSDKTSVYPLVEEKVKDIGKELDALDIIGLEGDYPLGTNTVKIDIKETLQETVNQYPRKFRKKLNRVMRERDNFDYEIPSHQEEKILIDWIGYWNDLEGQGIGKKMFYDLLQEWKGNPNIEVVREGIYKDGEYIGMYVMIIDEIAYGVWAVWDKERFKEDIDFGYLVNLRRMEICIERGIEELDLGSSFLSEHKERWGTRLVKYKSLGIGFRED